MKFETLTTASGAQSFRSGEIIDLDEATAVILLKTDPPAVRPVGSPVAPAAVAPDPVPAAQCEAAPDPQPEKPKRKRRTKAEMEAAKTADSADLSADDSTG